MKKREIAIGFFLLLFGIGQAGMPGPAAGDIYMFVDKNGVTHFTNAPTSQQFHLFMKGRGNQPRRPVDKKTYDHLIHRAARKFQVDFSLIKAVIEVESAYNARAVSSKGARGLMQIMPFNFKDLNISDPFEPAQNIMGGTAYLNMLLQQYSGNLEYALAAYNAGPSTVDKYNGIPPFRETQKYVQRVLSLHQAYKPPS